ncbi:hypothetical protein JMUB7531_29020 [Staphylococcus aureus]
MSRGLGDVYKRQSLTNPTNTCLFFQAEDGIRDLRMSRGLGDVYKRQLLELFEADYQLKSLVRLSLIHI